MILLHSLVTAILAAHAHVGHGVPHYLPLLLGFQIGPKIRVGGTLGHIGQQIKEGVGKVAKAAAPIVAFVPGVGQIAAPILEAGGNILDTSNGGIHNIGDVGRIAGESALLALPGATGLTSKLSGGATGLEGLKAELGNVFGGANNLLTKIPGVQGLEDMVGGGGAAGGAAGEAGPTAVSTVQGASPSASGGIAKKLSSIFGSSPGGMSAADKALLIASIAEQAHEKQRQQDLMQKGLDYSEAAYNSTAPLREQGISSMLHPSYTDLSSIFSDPANRYSRSAVHPATTAPGA